MTKKDHKTAILILKVARKLFIRKGFAATSISEIAKECSFTTSTIEGHLAHYIQSGEISIFEIVPKIKVAKIMAHLIQNPESSTVDTKIALGDGISYGELKAVLSHLAYIKAEKLT